MKIFSSITTCFVAAVALNVSAQDLPQPSPHASVSQTVGVTDFTIEYSRPGVKGREIWGGLVPYNEMWRAGANKATQFTASTDFQINGANVEKGTYSLFIVPNQEGPWEVILNKNTELWGIDGYDKGQDAARIKVPAQKMEKPVERMEFHFTEVSDEGAVLTFEWDHILLPMKIEVTTREYAMANIKEALAKVNEENAASTYRNAARYASNHEDMHDQALEWVDQSIEAQDYWYSHLLKAEILAKKGEYAAAIDEANMAMKAGTANAEEKGQKFNYGDRIKSQIEEWQSKK